MWRAGDFLTWLFRDVYRWLCVYGCCTEVPCAWCLGPGWPVAAFGSGAVVQWSPNTVTLLGVAIHYIPIPRNLESYSSAVCSTSGSMNCPLNSPLLCPFGTVPHVQCIYYCGDTPCSMLWCVACYKYVYVSFDTALNCITLLHMTAIYIYTLAPCT